MISKLAELMGVWAERISLGNPRSAGLVSGALSIAQFTVETICFLCFAVNVVPLSTVFKIFYSLAAVTAPVLLLISVVFVYSISKDNHRWMRPWLISYFIVTLTEMILSLIAFSLLNGLHDVIQFYNTAWSLAQYHANDQLYVGVQNESTCTLVSNAFLPSNSEAVRQGALFCQQGAHGLIASFTILLLLKNVFNVIMLYASFVLYREMEAGRGRQRNYAPSRTASFHDPHIRPGSARRQVHFSSIKTISN